MRLRNESRLVVFLVLLALIATPLILKRGRASEIQEVEFAVIETGYLSGYDEEAYLAVKTEVEWANVWERHIAPYIPKTPYPEITFSEKMIICAFTGERPTTGFNISVQRIWVDEEMLHVEIAKYSPSKGSAVGEALTYPYVFVSLEKTDIAVAFHVTEEYGTISEYTLPEFSMMMFATAFVVFSIAMIALMHKAQKEQNKH